MVNSIHIYIYLILLFHFFFLNKIWQNLYSSVKKKKNKKIRTIVLLEKEEFLSITIKTKGMKSICWQFARRRRENNMLIVQTKA